MPSKSKPLAGRVRASTVGAVRPSWRHGGRSEALSPNDSALRSSPHVLHHAPTPRYHDDLGEFDRPQPQNEDNQGKDRAPASHIASKRDGDRPRHTGLREQRTGAQEILSIAPPFPVRHGPGAYAQAKPREPRLDAPTVLQSSPDDALTPRHWGWCKIQGVAVSNLYTLEKSRLRATKIDTLSPWFFFSVGGMLICASSAVLATWPVAGWKYSK